MLSAQRFALCAALALAAAAPLAHAADTGVGPPAAAIQSARLPDPLGPPAVWYREPGARATGFGASLENGWRLAVNLGRANGGAGNVRADGRPATFSGGRRGLVLSLTRRFR